MTIGEEAHSQMNFSAIGNWLFGGSIPGTAAGAPEGFLETLDDIANAPPNISCGPSGPEPPQLLAEAKEEVKSQLPNADSKEQDFLSTEIRTIASRDKLALSTTESNSESPTPEQVDHTTDPSVLELNLAQYLALPTYTSAVQFDLPEFSIPSSPTALTPSGFGGTAVVQSHGYTGPRDGEDDTIESTIAHLPEEPAFNSSRNSQVRLYDSSMEFKSESGHNEIAEAQAALDLSAIAPIVETESPAISTLTETEFETITSIGTEKIVDRRLLPLEGRANEFMDGSIQTPGQVSNKARKEHAVGLGRPRNLEVVGSAVDQSDSSPDSSTRATAVKRVRPDETGQEVTTKPVPELFEKSPKTDEKKSATVTPTEKSIFSIGVETTPQAKVVRQPGMPLDRSEVESVVAQVADRLRMLAAARPKQGITIHLTPDDLGSITVVVRSIGQQVDASISASDERVRTALDQRQDGLSNALERHGFRLQSVTITQQPGPTSNGQAHQRNQSFDSGSRHPQNSDRHQEFSNNSRHHQYVSPKETERSVRLGRQPVTGVDLAI